VRYCLAQCRNPSTRAEAAHASVSRRGDLATRDTAERAKLEAVAIRDELEGHVSATIKPVERPLSALDVIFARRSVRAYEQHPLDTSTVNALLDAAVQAPTALHAEPWAFVVIQDRRVLKRLSDLAKPNVAAELAHQLSRSRAGSNAALSRFAQDIADPQFNIFYDAGTLVVICAKRIGPLATGDCWLAAENLMLAACAMGLGTCCIGSATSTLNTDAVKKDLGIPADVDVVAPIVVGVPRQTESADVRKRPEILSWT
jgi:nitroreductase